MNGCRFANSGRRILKNLINDLKRDEGFRKYPYKDTAGLLTVGYGRNLEEVGISEEEAEILLKNDASIAIAECHKLFPAFMLYDSARQDALANMMFNLGYSKLSKFKKMIEAIKHADWGTASYEALNSKWAKQVGERAERIAKLIKSGRR